MSWKKTSCCLCLQSCGLEVMVESNKIAKVRPDKANLRSQGYACRKGLKVAHYQHHRQRMEQPLKRRNDVLVPTGWDDVLIEIGQRLGETKEQFKSGTSDLLDIIHCIGVMGSRVIV